MDNLFQFLDKILPLISTLLGAYITYFVTVSSKKSELKVNAKTKARDEYWIPCSIAISNLQKKIVELTKKENCYVTFQGENSCEQELQELLKYLQADTYLPWKLCDISKEKLFPSYRSIRISRPLLLWTLYV